MIRLKSITRAASRRLIDILGWIDQSSQVTLLFWSDPVASWGGVLALIASSTFFYTFATSTVYASNDVGQRLIGGCTQSLLFVVFGSFAGLVCLCTAKWCGAPGPMARRLTRLLVIIWIVSLTLFALSNWITGRPWWDTLSTFEAALITSGTSTLLIALNTIWRRPPAGTGIRGAWYALVIVGLTITIALTEAAVFTRVVLQKPQLPKSLQGFFVRVR